MRYELTPYAVNGSDIENGSFDVSADCINSASNEQCPYVRNFDFRPNFYSLIPKIAKNLQKAQ
jgi:hypothetical protein